MSIISAYHLCKLNKMVSLRYLFFVDRKLIEVVALQKFMRGESIRNVARNLHICQS